MAITKPRRPAGNLQSDHVAVVKHGAHPEYRVEIDAFVDASNDSYVNIFQGKIVSLNSDGLYCLGANAGGVPSVSMKNIFDEDVTTGKGVANRLGTLSGIGGKITAIPVTAGYEFETTEFDKTAVYLIGMKLGVDDEGLLTPWVSGHCVGFVTVLPYLEQSYQHTRLGFLTAYLPGTTPTAPGSDSVPSISSVPSSPESGSES
jgi:hypothetical protein